jgi:hypothetical protein
MKNPHQDAIIGVTFAAGTHSIENINWTHSRVEADLSGLSKDRQELYADAYYVQTPRMPDGDGFFNKDWSGAWVLCENQSDEDALTADLDADGISYSITDIDKNGISQSTKDAVRDSLDVGASATPDRTHITASDMSADTPL